VRRLYASPHKDARWGSGRLSPIRDLTRHRSGSAGGHGNLRRVPASSGPGEAAPVFGFRSGAPAKDLPLYWPDEGALGATGA
jgi:hypothetical protein